MSPIQQIPSLLAALLCLLAAGRAVAQPAAETKEPPRQLAKLLADPALAEKLKLTDEQRMKIAALQTERAEALAGAAPDARDEVVDQFNEKLLAVLDETQQAALTQSTEADAPKLRFNFRFQRWTDVLDWFAEQAGLSLVLDAPPPGTFNYSDQREYTVPEALDLLNGVLLTKGFTLVRREKMLILVDLSQGLPETLVPRVKLDELGDRGRFEIVSVLFPVGRRSAEEVVTEIAPLLSPRGKSQPLPKTSQVLVTDTAGVMRAIEAVIESMPEPSPPKEPDKPEKPEKPQLAVYPIKTADPDSVIEVLQALMPDARFVRDPKVNQINAYATPTQQAAVKSVIEQMQSTEKPPEERPRFEVYPLLEVDPEKTLEALAALAPSARLSVDAVSRKLAAWATPEEHEILEKAIAQLTTGVGAVDDRQVEVYHMRKADPSSVVAMLQNVVPQARLAVDPPTKSIVALASLDEQKTIRATIDQIESRQAGGTKLRFYPLPQAPSSSLTSVLQTLVPTATVTVDAPENRLAVVATPEDHESVKQAIDAFAQASAEREGRKLVLYPVTPAQRKRFQAVLAELPNELPGVKVVTDAEPGELAIWANHEQHEVIAGIVEQLKKEQGEPFKLVAYTLQVADPTSVVSVLQNLFPETKLVVEPRTRKIVAWTTPEQQASIKSLVEQMDSDEAGDLTDQLMVYPVKGFEPSAAINLFGRLVPEAIITHDSKANSLVVWARKPDQTVVKAALERMQPGDDPARRPKIVSYPIPAGDPNQLYSIVGALVPGARLVPNTNSGTIVVWATPEDHKAVKAAIDEMTLSESPTAGKVVVYTLKETTASNVGSPLQTALPQARIGMGPDPRKLVVWARPEDHEKVTEILAELDQEQLSGNVPKSYAIDKAEPGTLLSTLQTLFATQPNVRMSLDSTNNRIVALATPAEHERIQSVIDEVEQGAGEASAPKVVVYTLEATDASYVIGPLQTAVPQARISAGQNPRTLVAWARPGDHETIRTTIEQLDKQQFDGQVMKAYTIERSEAGTLLNALQALFATRPSVRLSLDSTHNKIVALASPAEHETIQKVIDEVEQGDGEDGAAKVVVYTLTETDGQTVVPALQTAVPQARVSGGANSRQIVVWARPAEHETVRTMLAELDKEQLTESVPKAYAVRTADSMALWQTLQSLFATRPSVQLSLDRDNSTIVALASPGEHETIQRVIDEVEAGSSVDDGATFEVHALGTADGDSVLEVLQTTVTKNTRAQLSVDESSDQLVAVATPEQHERIRQAIERLQGAERSVAVFQLDVVEPFAAELAIEKLFGESGGRRRSRGEAPVVESDLSSARLYVRGAQDDLDEIRSLLVKMGETQLERSAEGGSTLRVIPFSGDARETLAEIERIWPRLSNHPLRVLAVPAKDRGFPKLEPGQPSPPAIRLREDNESSGLPRDADAPQGETRGETAQPIEVKTAQQQDEPAAEPQPQPAKQKPADDEAAAAQESEKPAEPAPIIVSPGEDSITIMSDDPEAIRQLEALVRTLSRPTGAGGRDINVYPLRSANANTVAELLKRLFDRGAFGFGDSGSPVIEADQRLNAVVVYAGRNDRAAIERLLEVLDSSDVPESLIADRPRLIPVEHTDAEGIEQVLRDIYQTQLSQGGAEREIPIPRGTSRDVAAVIQQINTAATGPLMTLGVDAATNSIVVMAPGPLAEEVAQLVAQLDEAAEKDTSRSVRVVRLKAASAEEVREALDDLIRDSARRRFSRRGRD
ncbi:MAG: hypothetical protein DWQ37_14330 [Planctomycetota bacterium]|nr:MAG: hypothetical protein DWQ37_14330 [Planctomycetota bacterium]